MLCRKLHCQEDYDSMSFLYKRMRGGTALASIKEELLPSIYFSIYLSFYLSVCLSFYVFIYLAIYLSIYLSLYIYTYLYIAASIPQVASRLWCSYTRAYVGAYDLLGVEYDPLVTQGIEAARSKTHLGSGALAHRLSKNIYL